MITYTGLGRNGRLGNQMFQIASSIGIAKKNNHSYCFPEWRYSSYFATSIPQCELKNIKPLYKINIDNFHYKEINISDDINSIIDIGGYLQTEKYFIDCKKDINSYFQPNDIINCYIDSKYTDLFKHTTCSIHIRRTDYINLQQHHPLCTLNYYQSAIGKINDKSIKFVVFSDDINWCKNAFRDNKFYFVEGEEDIIDLFIMSRCKHNIIANSSFSWWGAWLNNNPEKKIIAPKVWLGERYNHLNQGDLIPDEWQRI